MAIVWNVSKQSVYKPVIICSNNSNNNNNNNNNNNSLYICIYNSVYVNINIYIFSYLARNDTGKKYNSFDIDMGIQMM